MKMEINEFARHRSQYWWLSLLMGLFYIVLGIWFFATPLNAILALKFVAVIGFFVGGIVDISGALSNRKADSGWGWRLGVGCIDVIFGLLLFTLPLSTTTMLLVYFIGFWILFRSLWAIGAAIELRKYEDAGWLLGLGIVSLIFAIWYLFSPVCGGMTVMLLACLAFVCYGLFRIYYALTLRAIHVRSKK